MPISYTNRKGQIYFLCQGTTKLGKPRYNFVREPKGTLAKKVPEGYTIQESVNGIVSLAKTRPMLLSKEEIAIVTTAVNSHPQANVYRVDAKHKQIMIYERVGPDLDHLASVLGLNAKIQQDKEILHRIDENKRLFGQFTPIMRFTLVDEKKRHFRAERMRFSGIDHWIVISADKLIVNLGPSLISVLGTDKFFELY
jgi:hypothetical protein